jgi:hypothetical protein
VDKLLVLVAQATTATAGSRTFFCTNSEGAGHSGFRWVVCIVDNATRSSVASAMEDETVAEPWPREGSMCDGDLEEDEDRGAVGDEEVDVDVDQSSDAGIANAPPSPQPRRAPAPRKSRRATAPTRRANSIT